MPRESAAAEAAANPLQAYFDAHHTGPGIWKWTHYFDMYHRHLAKFAGTDARLVEIGVYSGGSLSMWREYLGPAARITGIDIAEECKAYEGGQIGIEIGDQADRRFWSGFRERHPRVDVVIDDGGHLVEQQIVTLEELLPHLAPGGVYICEDIHGRGNHFAAFAHALADALNAAESSSSPAPDGIPRHDATAFQAMVRSIAFYPFAVVIERNERPRRMLEAPKHGTEWQPFFDQPRR